MIPIVDCQGDPLEKTLEIQNAFETVGSVHLKNYGINAQHILEMFETGQIFWALPLETKLKFCRPKGLENIRFGGYRPENLQDLYKEKRDVRESFDFRRKYMMPNAEKELPELFTMLNSFQKSCEKLTLQILKIFARKFVPQDEEFFTKYHNFDETATTLCISHYNPIIDEDHKKNEVIPRLEEHTDLGILTFIFQNRAGWLEVTDRKGNYLSANHGPGDVLIFTGDIMQIWSADKVPSVLHRVSVPKSDEEKRKDRLSIIFFVHPDDDWLVEPLDGVSKNLYKPVLAGEFVWSEYAKIIEIINS